jgi:hypothetical protein
MANTNGFGNGVIYSCGGITTNNITGSVVGFTLAKEAEIKETTDSNNNFMAAYKGKMKKVGTLKVILTSSGSAMILPEILTTCTATNPYSADCTGNWAVYKSSVDWKNDDYAQLTQEIQQLTTSTGTIP